MIGRRFAFAEKFRSIIRSLGKRRGLLTKTAAKAIEHAFIDIINRGAAQWEESTRWEFIKIERLESTAPSKAH